MVLVKQGKAQVVGWTDLITNGDLEDEDVSCFYSKENGGAAEPSVITDGVGVDDSRGIMVHSARNPARGNQVSCIVRYARQHGRHSRHTGTC